MTAARARRGFTLLEVMVAIAILAMGLMAASEIVGGALRNHARARQLELATLLARAKLAELEDHYEEKGFRDFDEEEDGTFDEEGHPEVRWKVEVVKPDLGTDAGDLVRRLTGKSLEELFGAAQPASGGAGGAAGPTQAGGLPPAVIGLVQGRLTELTEKLKKGLREVRLTVSWGEPGRGGDDFTVVTHLVVFQARETMQ